MSLWQKDKAIYGSNAEAIKKVADFTVGHDREMDSLLAAYDVQGSLAHIEMLHCSGS